MPGYHEIEISLLYLIKSHSSRSVPSLFSHSISLILYIVQYILVSATRTRSTLFELGLHYHSMILLGVSLALAVEPDEATVQVRRKGKPDAIRGQQPRRFTLGRTV